MGMGDGPLPAGLSDLIAARRGHFRYESGHHGDLWLELDALFLRPRRLRPLVDGLAARLAGHGVAVVCGPMVGGAFLAQRVAEALDAGFVHADRLAPPPGDALFAVRYRVPDALRPLAAGEAVAVVDDVINAGSATLGALADLRALGARPVALGALLVLGDAVPSAASAEGLPLEALARLPNNLWLPSACPLCAAGLPLDGADSPAS